MTDLVVAGGGPVGLAVAIRARLAGLSVTVLERRKPPVDQACGEGLMPSGVDRLTEKGIDLGGLSHATLRGLRFVDDRSTTVGEVEGRPLVGLRRTLLHGALARRAEDLGAQLEWGRAVTGLRTGGFETADGPVEGRWLVAADGRRSPVRRWAGLERRHRGSRRFGVRRHYEIRPWSDQVEVHWAVGAEAYVTPVGDEQVGVALLWKEACGVSFDRLLGRFPRLEERLAGLPPVSRDRGGGPFGQGCRRVADGRLALVGDAAGCLDAICGDGLSVGFEEAAAVVDSLRSGEDLGRYPAVSRQVRRRARQFETLLLLLADHPGLRRRVLARLAASPGLMSRLVQLKVAGASHRAGCERVALLRLVLGLVVGSTR